MTKKRSNLFTVLAWSALVALLAPGSLIGQTPPTSAPVQIAASALAQIQALLDEKEARTPAQKKLDSHLLQALRESRGQTMAPGVTTLIPADVGVDANGRVVVDIKGAITEALRSGVLQLGGTIVSAHEAAGSLRAEVPLSSIEAIGALPDVRFVYPKEVLQLANGNATPVDTDAIRPSFDERARTVRAELPGVLARVASTKIKPLVGSVQSEGDRTHDADTARSTYGYDGTGLRIGVISDSIDGLILSQANGNLGPVTIVPGQSGIPATGEGTAMLEIVHDVAPGAMLFFATANGGQAQFATNIQTLRNSPYSCDIIVDDVFYLAEPVFEDGVIAQAVDTVSTSGALYFSSAGNEGNLDSVPTQTGCWEGDFLDGGASGAPLPLTGNVHDFGGGNLNDRFTGSGSPFLFWNDQFGHSGNDYDFFVLNDTATTLLGSSTNVQSGSGDPWEGFGGATGPFRLVVIKKTGAAARFLHVTAFRGRLAIGTSGQNKGHSAAASAYSVAALPAASPFSGGNPTGPYPAIFNTSNLVEFFSSDGLRRIYSFDGSFNPTSFTTRQKPDITAADGVSTSVPGFAPFFGTSAAAPHAAAIAAIVKEANPAATTAALRTMLTAPANVIDIMGAGTDRNSGAGIVMPKKVLDAAPPTAVASLILVDPPSITQTLGGNANPGIEPGESGDVVVTLANDGAASATGVSATLALTSPVTGVTIVNGGPRSFGTIASGASANNSGAPFRFHLDAATASCVSQIAFTLTVTFGGGATGVSPHAIPIFYDTGTAPVVISTTLDATTAPTSPPYTGATDVTTGPRLFRASVNSTCTAPKAFPGTSGSSGYRFDSYTLTNPSPNPACITAYIQTCTSTALFASAYSPTFDKTNVATNWLADVGASNSNGNTTSFSFTVPGSSTFVVVVMETSNTNPACTYTLTISGLPNCTPGAPVNLLRFETD